MAAKMIAARLMPEPQKTRKTFLGGREMSKIEINKWRRCLCSIFMYLVQCYYLQSKEAPAQGICSTHLKTGSNDNSERRNLGCKIIVIAEKTWSRFNLSRWVYESRKKTGQKWTLQVVPIGKLYFCFQNGSGQEGGRVCLTTFVFPS